MVFGKCLLFVQKCKQTAYFAMLLSSLSEDWDEAGISTITEGVGVVCGSTDSAGVSAMLRRVSSTDAGAGAGTGDVVKGKDALVKEAAGAEETPLGVINCSGTCPCSSSWTAEGAADRE